MANEAPPRIFIFNGRRGVKCFARRALLLILRVERVLLSRMGLIGPSEASVFPLFHAAVISGAFSCGEFNYTGVRFYKWN